MAKTTKPKKEEKIIFKDDKLDHIDDDVQKIQAKSSMYISQLGVLGALHLGKEVIQNSIDECVNENSPGKNIYVVLDVDKDKLTVRDDGRGIPEDNIALDIVCTKIQAGSKFTREGVGFTSGENGVGITATNALSDMFELSTIRNSIEHKISFKDGVKIDDKHIPSKIKHGTITSFIPSKKYLGRHAKIPRDGLVTWIDMISHFIPEKTKIHLDIVEKKTIDTKKFSRRPFSNILDKRVVDQRLTEIIHLSDKIELSETINEIKTGKDKKVKRELILDFVFNFSDSLEPYNDSFCNYINTTSGGVHINAVKEALWRFFMKKCNENSSDKEKEKYKVLKVDIETGLNVAVNLFTNMQMQLVGQTKNAVGNDELYAPIKELALNLLESYFETNKSLLLTIVKIIKMNTKARIDASKIKAASVKNITNKFELYKFKSFIPCNNTGKAYKELWICEGTSALGGMADGGDPDTQAFLAFRGVTANAFKRSRSNILDNAEYNRFVTICKTDYGNKFDINKLYYDKIIMGLDADADGDYIRSSFGAFLCACMPELVTAGKIYVALPPLYNIDDKSHPYVRSKFEIVDIYQKRVVKNYKIIIPMISDDYLSNKDFKEFIYDIHSYGNNIQSLAEHYRINKSLCEKMIYLLGMFAEKKIYVDDILSTNKYRKNFIAEIQNVFPEMKLTDNGVLRGVVDGSVQSIKLKNNIITKSEAIEAIEVLTKYGDIIKVTELKHNTEYSDMGIIDFIDIISVHIPNTITRYKGLGEMNSEQLWETTLNPDTRVLIQLTMDDIERDLAIFENLHGESKSNRMARREMVKNFKATRDDIDN